MEILFDPRKRVINLAKHGFDFAALSEEFFATATVLPGNGTGRYVAINGFDGVSVAVVFQPYGREAVSVISMRHATRAERSAHRG